MIPNYLLALPNMWLIDLTCHITQDIGKLAADFQGSYDC
jgi:hypothetical protein